MCGVAGSGKTTYARGLQDRGFARLSVDEHIWSTAGRFGIDYPPERYEDLKAEAERAVRARLVELLGQGRDVVVDLSFWRRADRERYKAVVEAAGARWRLVWLRVEREELRRRLARRAERFDANAAFPITDDVLDRFLAGFEEPSGEGEELVDLPPV